MTDERNAKIRELRAMAEEFRERARLTVQVDYIRLMKQTAQELENFADALAGVSDSELPQALAQSD